MSRLETNGYYALGVPVYVLVAAIEYALARRKGVQAYSFAVTVGNLMGGLGEVVIGLFIGPLLLGLYDFAFEHARLFHWAEGSWVPWVLAFLAGDLCYYVYHRASPRVGGLWAIHGVHHQSDEFNLSIALRNPWFSDFYSAIFYAPLPLLGVPPGHFFIAISAISFYAVTAHSRVFHRPGLYVLVNPATHIVHHAINPRYLNRNFGAMFTLWDRLFGTHVEVVPEDPPRLGTLSGYETHDGALAQFVLFRNIFAVARRANGLADKLRAFVYPPGWRPAGVPRPAITPPRGDEAIPLGTKLYVAWQFTLPVVFAMYVLWLRDGHPFWMQVASSAMILASCTTLGGILDGRADAGRHEAARLGAAALLGAALCDAPGYAAAGATVLHAAIGGALALLLLARVRGEPARVEALG